MVLEVIETDPGVRGDTASGGTKPATVEGGAVVRTGARDKGTTQSGCLIPPAAAVPPLRWTGQNRAERPGGQ